MGKHYHAQPITTIVDTTTTSHGSNTQHFEPEKRSLTTMHPPRGNWRRQLPSMGPHSAHKTHQRLHNGTYNHDWHILQQEKCRAPCHRQTHQPSGKNGSTGAETRQMWPTSRHSRQPLPKIWRCNGNALKQSKRQHNQEDGTMDIRYFLNVHPPTNCGLLSRTLQQNVNRYRLSQCGTPL